MQFQYLNILSLVTRLIPILFCVVRCFAAINSLAFIVTQRWVDFGFVVVSLWFW
jgi:hypothetical protein